MGAFDQFKDQADEYADKVKNAAGDKRKKSAGPESRERMERRVREDEHDLRPRFEDGMRERMDSEPDERDGRV